MKRIMKTHRLLSYGVSKLTVVHAQLATNEASKRRSKVPSNSSTSISLASAGPPLAGRGTIGERECHPSFVQKPAYGRRRDELYACRVFLNKTYTLIEHRPNDFQLEVRCMRPAHGLG